MNTHHLEKTHSGASLLPLETACFDQGTVFLDGTINEETATRFIQNGILLARKQIPMTVVFNTNGGDLRAGLNIYDFITAQKDVTTVALKAYSMGSLLFVAGKKRIMFPHSDLMIHEPLLSSGVSGSCSEILTVSDHLKSERERMIRLYAEHTKMTTADVRKFMKKDTYFTPDQAAALGFCDAVMTWDEFLKGGMNHA